MIVIETTTDKVATPLYTHGAAHFTNAGIDLVSLDADLSFGSAVAVTEALTTIAEFSASGEAIGIQFDVATNNLDQFVIYGKFGSGGTYQSIYSAAADYLVPTGALIATSGDLTTVAAAATGTFIILSRGFYSFKLACASSNVAGSSVTVYGSAS